MATTQFTADVNKTVTIEGIKYTITIPSIPTGTHFYFNEVEVTAGESIILTENATITITTDLVTPSTIDFTASNLQSATFNGTNIIPPVTLTPIEGVNTLDIIGATAIPSVELNGSGLTSFSINGAAHNSAELPYTFQPLAGQTNSIFAQGEALDVHKLTIAGTDIESMTVNGVPTDLPLKDYVLTEDTAIAVAGEIYQLDVSSNGGATINVNGTQVTDGTASLHQVIDVDKDTYLTVSGEHVLTVDGQNIKSVSINGVTVPVENLPASIKNLRMSANVVVNGYEPSEVHITGLYQEDVVIDGVTVPVSEDGHFDVELTTVESNHFVNVIGKQPRPLEIVWNDNDVTTITMDNVQMVSGTTSLINKDVLISATSLPIPVHFEQPAGTVTEVNGREYISEDFTVNVTTTTEVDIEPGSMCRVTISDGSTSYTEIRAASLQYFAPPHRDFWVWDGWSSKDVGISDAKQEVIIVDLTGKTQVNLQCHYQRRPTWNSPS